MQVRFQRLANDVREHARDLQVGKRRPENLKAFHAVANPEQAAWRFELSIEFAEQQWESEGGAFLCVTQ